MASGAVSIFLLFLAKPSTELLRYSRLCTPGSRRIEGERQDRDPVVLEAGNYARDFSLTTASMQSGSTMLLRMRMSRCCLLRLQHVCRLDDQKRSPCKIRKNPSLMGSARPEIWERFSQSSSWHKHEQALPLIDH